MKKEFRKHSILITVLAGALMLSGCGGDDVADRRAGNNNIDAVMEQQMQAEDAKKTEEASTEAAVPLQEPTTQESSQALQEPDPNVDVDLTVMGKDMVYATVYQMMCYPDEYIGKKIKANGTYTACWYEETSKWYTYCLIKDALACCQQGLEFTWEDGSHDISEFPEEGTDIEIIGTFRVYKDFEEDEVQYCELADATMTILDENSNTDNNQ